jgi:hypothetical protein
MLRRIPFTLPLGLAIILVCELLLFADVYISHRGPVHSDLQIQSILRCHPQTPLAVVARFMAINMTAFVWVGYILLLEGVLTIQMGRSPVRSRPHHFALLALASVFIWCVFDWINFYFIHAWDYVGMPPLFLQTLPCYILAFGSIVPGMLMSGQILLNLGLFNWARSPQWTLPAWAKWLSFIAGCAMLLWPILLPDPITNLTLWTSLVFLLDPINLYLNRPSMFRDWQNGWYGRTLAAFAGGLICGLLWEFWNYYALAKWTYHLPFLGSLEHYRYFEMPLLGLLGFIPFGIECWIMWQTLRIPFDGLVEPLPDDHSLL